MGLVKVTWSAYKHVVKYAARQDKATFDDGAEIFTHYNARNVPIATRLECAGSTIYRKADRLW